MIIKGAEVFLGQEGFARVDVQIQGDKIVKIGPNLSGDADVHKVDGYLIPGMIDLHTHGYCRHDTMYGAESVLFMSIEYAKMGVTSFLPTTVTAPIEETGKVVREIADVMQSEQGARILGIHLEGPFIECKYKGAQIESAIIPPSVEALKGLCGGREDAVKLLTLAPEKEGAEETIRYAVEHGIVVSLGHTDATCEQTQHAFDCGATQVTHLFNAMSPIHHRLPGVPTAALLDDRVSVQVIADGVHLHPAILQMVAKLKPNGITLITDSMEATALEDGVYSLGKQEVFVKNGEARLATGNLAGSTLTLDEGVRRMMRLAKLPLERVVPMVTSIPAGVLKRDDLGVIKESCTADLCLLDREHHAALTIVGGRIVYTRQA